MLTPARLAPSVLRRLGKFREYRILIGRGLLRSRLGSGSLGSPSGFHRSRELRTTFWGQIEFSLHSFDGTWSLNSSRLYSNFTSADGRFPFFLSRAGCRCRFEFLFQLCELLRTFLQASFQTPDFLTKILRLHMGSTLLPPVADTTSAGYRVNDKNLLMSRHITAPSRSAYTGSVARK